MSVRYAKVPSKDGVGDRFTKNSLFIKKERIPPDVLEKLEYATEIEYDDRPDKRRCLFCEAYQSRISYLNSNQYDLCEWHYQHTNKGQLAAQVALVDKENKLKAEKAPVKKVKKKTKKTALSAMIAKH